MGWRDAFVLLMINVKTRQVVHSPTIYHPNEALSDWGAARDRMYLKKCVHGFIN
ncbi:MAG: hypothetical protein SGJ20_18380 [Planctomycetota bacterium]|nr:hypothetical protein [Planctomycetota bacterium]